MSSAWLKRIAGAAVALAAVGSVVFLMARPASPRLQPELPIRRRAYAMLDEVRDEKRRQLTEYLDRIREQAERVRGDAIMCSAFQTLLEFERARRVAAPPPKAVEAVATLKANIVQHCLQHYGAFYDVLFVAADGEVFHAVRHVGPVGKSFFAGALKATSLARRLERCPDEAFVDFEHPVVSDEPSAFFVEPVNQGGRTIGWFLMQCSIQRINEIFARHKGLGRTGETFLVNADCKMLTESRFRRDSSILRLPLAPENIESKFAEGRGHKIVTDYRGCRALTSFDVCSVLGSRWLLVAKIDEAEVLTDHYRRYRRRLRPKLVEALAGRTPAGAEAPGRPEDAIVVDLDEYRRARGGDVLMTYGVRTCTALCVALPGEFAYLGHASVYDAIYGAGSQDLVNRMIDRVRTYEICPYQMRQLQVEIVAPHTDSLAATIDRLVDAGLLLSQIRFLSDPSAVSATVWHDTATGRTWAAWKPSTPGRPATCQQAADAEDLAGVLKSLVAY